jgi:Spy/CpxP family protein refolding chaperone
MTILLILVFVVAMGAGAVLATLAERVTNAPENSDNSWLADKLQLSAQQREQMRGFWEHATDTSHDCMDRRAELQKKLDQEISDLLNNDQKTRYNELSRQYQQKFQKLETDQTLAFNQAVDQTNKILTPEQQKKYEQILSDRVGHRPGSMANPNTSLMPPATQEQR